MPMQELHKTWTFAGSTGAGAWFDCQSLAREHTFYLQTAAGSTTTLVLQTAMDSTSTPVQIGLSQTLDASSAVIVQLTGPFALVRPNVSALTSTGTLVVRLIGN